MTESTALPTPSRRVRPAGERFHSQRSWLDSWHSFSFADHHHPDWMGFGPLRVINDDVISAGKGFSMHPHRDMEIITVMVEGQLNHSDSMGHQGVIRAGDVQRMSAGTGIQHSEINGGISPCRLLQIWIEPSQSGLTPSYEQQSIAVGSNWTPLIAPDQPELMAIARPARVWRARPTPDQPLALPTLADGQGWIQMIDGQTIVQSEHNTGHSMTRGDGLGWSSRADQPRTIQAVTSDTDVLLFNLQ